MTADLASVIATRVQAVRNRVARIGRDPAQVRIVAVTKGFGPEEVEAAVRAGVMDVGENYAQELLAKAPKVPPEVRWHFVGPIQRNKVAHLAPLVRTWHTVDRAVEAEAIARGCPGTEVMVQVNVDAAPSKAGCRPQDVDHLVSFCRTLPLDLSGLMAVGPAGDLEQSRRDFHWLAAKAQELGLRELSMGMSDDFEVALSEGATTLRLGRVIFGSRPERLAGQR